MNQRFSKSLPGILLLFIALLIYWFTATDKQPVTKDSPSERTSVNTEKHRHEPLVYTKHARCRMDCREITEAEIASVIQAGTINTKKSDSHDKPCPTIAYEGTGTDGHRLRIVIADCESNDKVVTVIDLDQDYFCECE
ncbi:MAG: DUF4258 domain-containing protein [Bacteroidetes bacterium]|nr:DUF4258 domain-containing protein [Bacteroidota bacterium]